jgi:hypothetical protein
LSHFIYFLFIFCLPLFFTEFHFLHTFSLLLSSDRLASSSTISYLLISFHFPLFTPPSRRLPRQPCARQQPACARRARRVRAGMRSAR